MAASNDIQKLTQYFASNFKKYEDLEELKQLSKVSNKIFDSLDDINYRLPEDIPLQPFGSWSVSLAGSTILHLAVCCRKLVDVKNLIERGADFTIKNGKGMTVLHDVLLSHCPIADIVPVGSYISLILSAHVDYNISENPSNNHGLSHFHMACMENHVEAVKTFLKNGIRVDEAIGISSRILPGYTPLHIGAKYGSVKIVKALLKYGADISCKEVKGMTALHLLIERNRYITYSLKAAKPSVYKKKKADIELNEKIINMLLSKSNIQDCTGLSPLQIACTMQSMSKEKLTRLLANEDLHYSVSMNSVMWPGYTALHFAAHFNIETVELLLQNGANILAADAKKVTPFDLCMKKYEIDDIYHLITDQQNLKSIKFSGGSTKLSDFIFAVRNKNTFKSFIEGISSDISIYIPFDSPLWPGYTLLHLAIIFLGEEKEIQGKELEFCDYCSSDEEWETDGERETDEDDTHGEWETDGDDTDGEWETDEGDPDEKKADGGENVKVEKLKNKLNLKDIKFLLKKGTDVTAQDGSGRTPLHLAFRLQSKDLVDLLLNTTHKKTVNPIDDDNLSHLHIAVASGNKDLTEKLLEAHKSHVDVQLKFGFNTYLTRDWGNEEEIMIQVNAGSTALHIAVARGDDQTTKVLIQSGADIYVRDEFGLTPIHLMMDFVLCRDELGRQDFTVILEAIENLEDHVVESTGLNYLHVACCLDSKKVVENMLSQGADIESMINSKNSMYCLYNKMRPLEVAFERYALEVLPLLLDKGAELIMFRTDLLDPYPDHLDVLNVALIQNMALKQKLERKTGITLLHFACAAFDYCVAKDDIEYRGADANAQIRKDSQLWPGCTPLHLVVSKFWSDCEEDTVESLVKLLLTHGADVTSMDIGEETPIHRLCSNKRLKDIDYSQIVELLLEGQKDFSVNPANRLGLSHFHIACKHDCEKVVKQFLDHGVDPNGQINDFDPQYGGFRPLHLAIFHSSEKSLDLLLKHADLRLVDRLGNTPLHSAIKQYPSNFELFERMISAGADVMAENVYGITPFEMLLDSGKTPNEMIELLLRKGVCPNSFNSVSEEGYLAIAFYAINIDKKEIQMNPAFEKMMARDDLAVVDDMGRNAIHNLVSYNRQRISGCHHGLRSNSADNYTSAIDRLTRIGCNVDHQDKRGRTPLHIATQLQNYEAIIALFDCGANANITDENQKPPLAYTLEYGENKDMVKKFMFYPYYLHLSALSYFGFDLSEANVKLYKKARRIFQMNALLTRYDVKETETLKKWKIGASSINLYDLMTDKGITAYTMMNIADRLVIDGIFQKDGLREKVPNTCRFLFLRYNQARAELQTRLTLVEPAKVSLQCLAPCDVPDVCANIILGFLKNSELQNVIDAGFDSE